MQLDTHARERFSHIFWIGGSPCAGKSSIASILAGEYGLQTYSCDEQYEAHLKRAIPGRHPLLVNAAGMSWDEVWMRPVDVLVTRELAFYREEFEMVIEDLLAMPHSPPIVAEGAALLPECVAPMLARAHQAIWVVPSEEFQRKEYARREWVENILRQCRSPKEAWENWMGRDAGFAKAVARQARERGLEVVQVDGSKSIEENAEIVVNRFGLRP